MTWHKNKLKWLIVPLSPLFLGAVLTVSAMPPSAPATFTTTVYATAPLGAVVTTTVNIYNLGQPAAVAQLYEAWPPTLAAAEQDAPLRVPLPNIAGPLAADLLGQFETAPDGQTDMLIYLADQADLRAAASIEDWNARGAAVVEALQNQAVRTQANLLAELRAAGYAPRPYWIVNAIAVHGDRPLAEKMAGQPGVALITANNVYTMETDVAVQAAAVDNTAWGVDKINAPHVWAEWGDRGEGIVVANIDTGVAYSHTALLTAYRGWSTSGLTNAYNWYDGITHTVPHAPLDEAGHGTHTMGTMVGAGVGVAPGARWIAARGCGGHFCSDEALISSAQWILAPTDQNQANPRPDLRPHIVNNSWGGSGEDNWYLGYVEAWNASGIFSVFSNGNSGMWGCGSSGSPGNYAAAFSVGATDSDDTIASFSSLGPTSDGRIKPDLSAPGVSVPSAWPDGSIVNLSGTSMAAPHVAGAAALLWSANPDLIGDIETTRRLLGTTAQPLYSTACNDAPTARPNNVYGWGRLDVYQAVLAARVDVPWLTVPSSIPLSADHVMTLTVTLDARQVSAPGRYEARILVIRPGSRLPIPVTFDVLPAANTGRLSGQVQDHWTDNGIYGHLVFPNGTSAATDVNGYYTLTLPYDTYSLTATAVGYLPEVATVSFITDTVYNFSLLPNQPHLRLEVPQPVSATMPYGGYYAAPITIFNEGSQPLTVTVSVPPWEWSVEPSMGATLYDTSTLTTLLLADDMVYTNTLDLGFSVPIYGVLTDRLYLSSNGWVSAARPSVSQQYADCFPVSKLPAGTLAPFWADLDPSAGGAVRVGQVTSDTYVVSFEAVPPWRLTPDPLGGTYTFQIALHADGRVEYLYGPMGALPAKWGVGVSDSASRGQNLACYKNASLTAGQGWVVQNQSSPTLWLLGNPNSITIAAGGSGVVNGILRGLGYVPWRLNPFASVLRLTSNDPYQPVVDVPAQLLINSPPSNLLWLPLIQR